MKIGPAIRYTLRRNTASIMKIFIFVCSPLLANDNEGNLTSFSHHRSTCPGYVIAFHRKTVELICVVNSTQCCVVNSTQCLNFERTLFFAQMKSNIRPKVFPFSS